MFDYFLKERIISLNEQGDINGPITATINDDNMFDCVYLGGYYDKVDNRYKGGYIKKLIFKDGVYERVSKWLLSKIGERNKDIYMELKKHDDPMKIIKEKYNEFLSLKTLQHFCLYVYLDVYNHVNLCTNFGYVKMVYSRKYSEIVKHWPKKLYDVDILRRILDERFIDIDFLYCNNLVINSNVTKEGVLKVRKYFETQDYTLVEKDGSLDVIFKILKILNMVDPLKNSYFKPVPRFTYDNNCGFKKKDVAKMLGKCFISFGDIRNTWKRMVANNESVYTVDTRGIKLRESVPMEKINYDDDGYLYIVHNEVDINNYPGINNIVYIGEDADKIRSLENIHTIVVIIKDKGHYKKLRDYKHEIYKNISKLDSFYLWVSKVRFTPASKCNRIEKSFLKNTSYMYYVNR